MCFVDGQKADHGQLFTLCSARHDMVSLKSDNVVLHPSQQPNLGVRQTFAVFHTNAQTDSTVSMLSTAAAHNFFHAIMFLAYQLEVLVICCIECAYMCRYHWIHLEYPFSRAPPSIRSTTRTRGCAAHGWISSDSVQLCGLDSPHSPLVRRS